MGRKKLSNSAVTLPAAQPLPAAPTLSMLALPSMRLLFQMIRDCGYHLVIRGCSDDLSLAFFFQKEKKVILYTAEASGAPYSIEQLCFSLAHEVRHLQHVELGLFPEYYPQPHKEPDGLMEALPEKSYLSLVQSTQLFSGADPLIGLKAENDCNRWARDFLNQHMPPDDGSLWPVMKYTFSGVDGYDDYQAIKSDRRSGAFSLALGLAKELDSVFNKDSLDDQDDKSAKIKTVGQRRTHYLSTLEQIERLTSSRPSRLSEVMPLLRLAVEQLF